ncbi:MAG: MBL fold metallo-hydrolase [Erysipelotrichaceae bacterium]|nr:MBL fold metallo-hydrolase [Erysipelotrichaceae bacterium]
MVNASAASALKIHVINTGHADAILLEYKGHYALFDGGHAAQYGKNDKDRTSKVDNELYAYKHDGVTYRGFLEAYQKCTTRIVKLGPKAYKAKDQIKTANNVIKEFEADKNNKAFLKTNSFLKDCLDYQSSATKSEYESAKNQFVAMQTLINELLDIINPPVDDEGDDDDLAKYSGDEDKLRGFVSGDMPTLADSEDTEEVTSVDEVNATEEEPAEEATDEQDSEEIVTSEETVEEEEEIPSDSGEVIEEVTSEKGVKATDPKKVAQAQLDYVYAIGYFFNYELLLDFYQLVDYSTKSQNDTIRYLKRHGIKHLDYVVCSHAHHDHIGGLASVLVNIDTDHVIYNGAGYNTRYYRIFDRVVREKTQKNEFDYTVADDDKNNTFTLGGDVLLTELTDTDSFANKYYTNKTSNATINNMALVWRVDINNMSILLTSDAEKDCQNKIIKNHPKLINVDVLQAPHHGYNNFNGSQYGYYEDDGHSANIDFCNKVKPYYVFVTNGNRDSATPSKLARKDYKIANIYVTTDQVHKASYEAIILSILSNKITVLDVNNRTVPAHTKHDISYKVTTSVNDSKQSNTQTKTTTSLHYASTKVKLYNGYVADQLSVKMATTHYYPNVYYQLSSKDSGYSNSKWVKGNTATLKGQFKGVVYFKLTNKFGEKLIRKTDGYDGKTPKTTSVKTSLYDYKGVLIKWNEVLGAKDYVVQYQQKGTTKWTTLKTTSATSYKAADLASGKGYYFRIKIKGYSAYKKSSLIYTLKKVSQPKVTKKTKTSTKVTWSKVSGASGYEVSANTTSEKKVVKTTTSTSATVSVKKGKEYEYYVRAYKTVSGKKIYAPWSNVRKFTCK